MKKKKSFFLKMVLGLGVVVGGFNLPLPYDLMKPGNVRAMGEVLKLEEPKETSINLHMVTVLGGGATPYLLLSSMMDPYSVIFPADKHGLPNFEEEKKKMIAAQSTAKKVAFALTGEETQEIYFNLEKVGGPSAGLIMTLEIINQITRENITKGLKVAGTGTIESDGTIGEVGSAELKIVAADRAGMDLFFLPKENYEKSKGFIEEYQTNMKIIPVHTVEEALNHLKGTG